MRAPHIVRIPLPNGGYLVCGPGADNKLGGYLAVDDDQEREVQRWRTDDLDGGRDSQDVLAEVFHATTLTLAELRARAAGWGPDATGVNSSRAPYYRLYLRVTEDEPGGWSAVVLNLPGTGSCGDSREEAVLGAEESVMAALEQYRADKVPVPWKALTPADFADGPVDTRSIWNE